MTEEERKKLVKKLEKFVNPLKKAGKIGALCAVINFCAPSAQAQTHSLTDKDPTPTTITYAPKTEKIHYQVDTMARGEKRALGSHSASKNTITINHSRTDKNFNQRSHAIETLIHEHQHQLAALNGAYDYPISLEQAYKLDMHDEIAAQIAVLLYKRNEYIKTDNLNVFDGFFSYYKDQIIAGKINPKSNTKEDFEKDMSVIADMTRIMWQSYYGTQKNYEIQHRRNADIYADKSGKYENFYNENYSKSLQTIYNISGVDFLAFMEQEVEISDGVRENLAKQQKSLPVSERATENKPINASKVLKENAHYPKWSSSQRVSPIQYAEIPVIRIDVPEGYYDQQIIEEELSQENVVDNTNVQKNKKGRNKEKKSKFWSKVGDFFRPSWKKTENTPTEERTTAQTPVSNPAPSKITTQNPPQNTSPVVNSTPQPKEESSENVSAQNKPTFKEKMHNFGEKLGDFFRPSWKEKPKKEAPAATQNPKDTVQTASAKFAPEVEQKTVTTATEQAPASSRISPTKSKIKINKLRTVKNKTAKTQQKEQPDHISPTRTQQKDMQKMKKEIEKYKQQKSANNN